jgi:hypothetical protein
MMLTVTHAEAEKLAQMQRDNAPFVLTGASLDGTMVSYHLRIYAFELQPPYLRSDACRIELKFKHIQPVNPSDPSMWQGNVPDDALMRKAGCDEWRIDSKNDGSKEIHVAPQHMSKVYELFEAQRTAGVVYRYHLL